MRKKVDENMSLIGGNIRKARQRSNLTQEQLAELVDITPQYLSDLERGVVGTSTSTLIKLSNKLNVTTDFLLFGSGREMDSDSAILIEKMRYMPKKKADLVERGLKILIEAIETEPDTRE